ncbi:MAG: S-methyl-5-thioribose-1-phosphate isomerase [Candidatus Aminicenantes bacterium]
MKPTVEWKNGRVVMIDQRRLPLEEVYLECRNYEDVAEAIETMVIRGAPAIGVAAAYGMALAVRSVNNKDSLDDAFHAALTRLERTRPTARNLFWALERMQELYSLHKRNGLDGIQDVFLKEAQKIDREDVETCRRIGEHGLEVIAPGWTILTHCNAGALATAGYGTALGVIRAAHAAHGDIQVYADETRPLLQGARLTCWELERDGIPVVLITDSMAGYLMTKGEVDAVVTGADRIAANGDTANKIGTYSLSVLARESHVPFYIAAPLSTIDFNLADGSEIPIEERDPREVLTAGGQPVAPPGIKVRNPAFDTTPAGGITGIITEKGIARPPYTDSLARMRREASS